MARHQNPMHVDEPALGPQARRALRDDLRDAVGPERAQAAEGAIAKARTDQPRSDFVGTITSNRMLIGLLFLTALVVGAIISLATGNWWFLVFAAAAHALGTVAFVALIISTTTETEHASPGTVALLEAEGVKDPDGLFNRLVDHASGDAEDVPRGTEQVLRSGANERTVNAGDDAVRASAEHHTAMTPGADPTRPVGRGSPLSAFEWGVVVALMLASIGFALVVGGAMWLAPAVVVPLGIGWIVLQHLMDDRGEEQAGAAGRPYTAGRAAPATRTAVVPAAIVVAIAAFCAVMVAIFVV